MVDSAPVLVERAAAETPEAFGMAGMDVGERWRVEGAGGGGSKVDGGTWDAVGGNGFCVASGATVRSRQQNRTSAADDEWKGLAALVSLRIATLLPRKKAIRK